MNEYRLMRKLMGSAFELVILSNSSTEAEHFLNMGVNEIQRIENLLSEFKNDSITSKINQNAGIEYIEVDEEVIQLLERCLQISSLTAGAFDITIGPLKKIYKFKNENFTLPQSFQITDALEKVGYKHLIIEPLNRKVFLSKKDMFISFAGIGKGYAADCVKRLWLQNGVTAGVVSASGDLCTLGLRNDGSPWKIGIAKPDQKNEMLLYIPIINASVATSGDYEQYFMNKGIRYSHNINPITGQPVTGIKSVSVVSPGAELSDALATAVYIMGVDAGLYFVNQLPNTHCLIIDEKNKVYSSKNISISNEA